MKKESITFKIDGELKDRLRDFCDSKWRTMTSVITESVLEYLEKHDNQPEEEEK